MDYAAIFGRNLRRIRKDRGLSQEELGFRAEMKRSYVSDIERGKRNPSLQAMGRLADALDIDLAELLIAQRGSS